MYFYLTLFTNTETEIEIESETESSETYENSDSSYLSSSPPTSEGLLSMKKFNTSTHLQILVLAFITHITFINLLKLLPKYLKKKCKKKN